MKNKLIIAGLISFNIITGIFLIQNVYLKSLWKTEAMNYAKFSAGFWAVTDFHKGKVKKLRLRIENNPKASINGRPEFDGEFIVKDWVGYRHKLPIMGNFISPNMQIASRVVNVYNSRMRKCLANPEKYKKKLADEINNWNNNVIKDTLK